MQSGGLEDATIITYEYFCKCHMVVMFVRMLLAFMQAETHFSWLLFLQRNMRLHILTSTQFHTILLHPLCPRN
jgi:hypothetical protein